MMWQDILLMVGGFGFIIALLPALWSNEKPPRITCASTGAILLSFTIVYGSLGLWLAFIATMICASLWFVLLINRGD